MVEGANVTLSLLYDFIENHLKSRGLVTMQKGEILNTAKFMAITIRSTQNVIVERVKMSHTSKSSSWTLNILVNVNICKKIKSLMGQPNLKSHFS